MQASVPQELKQGGRHATFELLSAPDPWIESLLSTVDHATKRRLLQTCTTLKSKLLHSQRVLLEIELNQDSLQADEVRRQQVILQQAANVKLHASGGLADDAELFLSRLLIHHMALMGGPLRNITAVYLEARNLLQVVPSSLVAACPNMKVLELEDCTFNVQALDEDTPPIPVCPQLTVLSLWCDVSDSKVALHRAARALPNLNTFQCMSTWNSSLWAALLPMSTHLKQLTLSSKGLGDVQPLQQLVNLTHVKFFNANLTDSLMEALLSLPNLKHVSVKSVKLQGDYHQHVCHWECLRSYSTCGIDSLAHLPISGVQRLEMSSVGVLALNTQAHAAGAVINMARCAGWHAPGNVLKFDAGSENDLSCMSALPLLQHVKGCWRLNFYNITDVSPSFIDRLSRHIPLNCKSVEFHSCTWGRGSLYMLDSSLPRFVKIVKEVVQQGRGRGCTECVFRDDD